MGRTRNKQLEDPHENASQPSTNPDLAYTQDSGVVPPTGLNTQEDKLDLILKEIRGSRAALEMRIDAMSTNLNLLQAEHKKLVDKVKSNKMTLDDLVPQQTLHSTQLDQLQSQLKCLQDKVDDAEGRSCRNNVRILGLPERSEGTNPVHRRLVTK